MWLTGLLCHLSLFTQIPTLSCVRIAMSQCSRNHFLMLTRCLRTPAITPFDVDQTPVHVQAKKMLAAKKAAASKKSTSASMAAAAAREAKERAKKKGGKKDTKHYNQVSHRLPSNVQCDHSCPRLFIVPAVHHCCSLYCHSGEHAMLLFWVMASCLCIATVCWRQRNHFWAVCWPVTGGT